MLYAMILHHSSRMSSVVLDLRKHNQDKGKVSVACGTGCKMGSP